MLELPSFEQLASVQLGMTAKDLFRARPTAQLFPYTGMYDVIRDDTVSFHFPDGRTRGNSMVLQGSARLAAVSRFDYLASADAADSSWRALTTALVSSPIGGATTCYEYAHGTSSARAAVAHADSVWVGTILYPDDPKRDRDTRQVIYEAAVRTFLTSSPTIFIPVNIAKRTIACP